MTHLPLSLFRVLYNLVEMVHLTFDGEIEPPIAIDACLPEIEGFVVLLRVERGGWLSLPIRRLACLSNALRTVRGAPAYCFRKRFE